jgi:SAM-dependent methyltransferase
MIAFGRRFNFNFSRSRYSRMLSKTTFYSNDFEFDESLAQRAIPHFVETPLTAAAAEAAVASSARAWHKFYGMHGAEFFHSRSFLFQAFPQLIPLFEETLSASVNQSDTATLLELGCGNGSNVYPLVLNLPKRVKVLACDVTPSALRAVTSHPSFEENKDRIKLFLYDIIENSQPLEPPGMILTKSIRAQELTELNSSFLTTPREVTERLVDGISCTFVLSALHPKDHRRSLHNISSILRSGGKLFFRDYAIGDAALSRMSPEARLHERLYKRGDGTLAYFFTKQELIEHLSECGFCDVDLEYHTVRNKNRKSGVELMRVFLNGVATRI